MPRYPTVSRKQEKLIRTFVADAEAAELPLGKTVWAIFLSMLDYKELPSGALVSTDTQVRIPFGGNFDDYPDEYGPDGEEFHADNSKDTPSPSSGESS